MVDITQPMSRKSKKAEWASIPEELRLRKQWCFTSSVEPKIPRTRGSRRASVAEPADWLTFDEACFLAVEAQGHVGFVLSDDDPYCCIDLDVKDTTTVEARARHDRIVDEFDSYTEWSTGGQGRHVWLRGNASQGVKRDGVEIYSQRRFMICTGRVARAAPIQPRPELLAHLRDQIGKGQVSRSADWALEAETDGGDEAWYAGVLALDRDGNFLPTEYGRLFSGEWTSTYPSQSEADLALMIHLARLDLSDRTRIEAFRISGLGRREKAKRDDYVARTLSTAKAIAQQERNEIDRGRDISRALLEGMPTCACPESRFRIFTDRDLDRLQPTTWIVKGLIPERGVGCIFGASGSGKTFLTLDLLAYIANGWSWFGRKVKPKPVVYLPLEGQAGIPRRVAAWRANVAKAFGVEASSKIHFIMDGFNAKKPAEVAALADTLLTAGLEGAVICIDTLAQSAPGMEENSSEGMGTVLAAFQDLERRIKGVVIVIHHTGKDADRGMRGWSGLQAAVDFALECQAAPKRDGDRQVFATKVKDGEAGFSLRFKMTKVPLGLDADGDHVTSLVISPLLEFMGKDGENQPAVDADMEDDNFIWSWIAKESTAGNQPSANSLQSQLAEMAAHRKMSQARVRSSVHRLLSANRLRREPKARHGNPYLVAVERVADPPADQ